MCLFGTYNEIEYASFERTRVIVKLTFAAGWSTVSLMYNKKREVSQMSPLLLMLNKKCNSTEKKRSAVLKQSLLEPPPFCFCKWYFATRLMTSYQRKAGIRVQERNFNRN